MRAMKAVGNARYDIQIWLGAKRAVFGDSNCEHDQCNAMVPIVCEHEVESENINNSNNNNNTRKSKKQFLAIRDNTMAEWYHRFM